MPKNNANDEVRLDKWLWAARFYKTRSIARSMIEGGKVDYNGVKANTPVAALIATKNLPPLFFSYSSSGFVK